VKEWLTRLNLEIMTYYNLILPEFNLVLNLKPNPNQIKSNFTWILGEGEYLRGWGLGINLLEISECNEQFLRLLSN